MSTPDSTSVTLRCRTCNANLVPILGKWAPDREVGTRAFRCPRFGACGYGGVEEDVHAVRAFRKGAPAT